MQFQLLPVFFGGIGICEHLSRWFGKHCRSIGKCICECFGIY